MKPVLCIRTFVCSVSLLASILLVTENFSKLRTFSLCLIIWSVLKTTRSFCS